MKPVYGFRYSWLILPAILVVSACTSASLESAVPGARNTGTYPNLNIPTVVATEQLTDEEAVSRLEALQTTRGEVNAVNSEKKSQADRLRRLGQTHAKEAIEEIED